MKPQFKNTSKTRAALIVMSGVALAFSLAAPRAQAGQWDKQTRLTINAPMQVESTVLQPGTYIFRLNDVGAGGADRHIVEIFNADKTHLITQVLALPDWRVQATGGSHFIMYETPAGYVPALKAWYYPGDNFGQEFTYPKHLEQVAVTQTNNQTVAQATPPPAPAPAPAVVEEQQQTEIAQNTPPPPPAQAEQPAPAPEPQPAPTVLPKTASSFPLIGLMGALLVGLGGVIRRAYTA